MSGQQTRQWLLANPPSGEVALSGLDPTFTLKTVTLPRPGPDQVLLKTLYFSNDPAQRPWIQKDLDPARMYTEPVAVGTCMRAFGILEVVESNAGNLRKGQLVFATSGWTEYAVLDAKECRPIQPDDSAGIRPTHFLGALGGPGLTAYYGLIDVVHAKADDIVVVSGAAGATGNMVVQIAKRIVGAKKIIGIAGGSKKCKWVESLGADVCVDYKSPDFEEQLVKATGERVNVYFDNVGGEILDLVISRMKRNGRIAACGAIAEYNQGQPKGIRNWVDIIVNRLEVRGFVVSDAIEEGKIGPILQRLVKGMRDGDLEISEDAETIVPTTFEDVPKTWTLLFSGANQGKLVTKLV